MGQGDTGAALSIIPLAPSTYPDLRVRHEDHAMTTLRTLHRATLATTLTAAVALLGACNRDTGTPAPEMPPAAAPATPAATDQAAPAAGAPSERAPAAITVGDVLLGTQAEGAGRVADPKTTFAPGDRTIVASVLTDAAAPANGTLRARWTYQDGQLVDETSQTLDTDGAGVTNFRIANQEDWPTGTYTVEISIDGEVAQTREFTVE